MLIQYLLLVSLGAALGLTWRRAKQGALSFFAAALWSGFWIASAVLVLRPEFASAFASLLGVGRGVDAVIYLAILGLFYLVFRVFLRIDKIERDITLLVRKESLAARDHGKEASTVKNVESASEHEAERLKIRG